MTASGSAHRITKNTHSKRNRITITTPIITSTRTAITPTSTPQRTGLTVTVGTALCTVAPLMTIDDHAARLLRLQVGIEPIHGLHHVGARAVDHHAGGGVASVGGAEARRRSAVMAEVDGGDRLHAHGGTEVLVHQDTSVPRPAPGQALVTLNAASVNPVDWLCPQIGR